MKSLQDAAHRLRNETYALYLAYRDPRTPWYARLFAACVVAYAFSPVDLIPDVIPVLGYLDDFLLVPLGSQGLRAAFPRFPSRLFFLFLALNFGVQGAIALPRGLQQPTQQTQRCPNAFGLGLLLHRPLFGIAQSGVVQGVLQHGLAL